MRQRLKSAAASTDSMVTSRPEVLRAAVPIVIVVLVPVLILATLRAGRRPPPAPDPMSWKREVAEPWGSMALMVFFLFPVVLAVERVDESAVLGTWRSVSSEHVAHLSPRRALDPVRPLAADARRQVVDAVNREANRFATALDGAEDRDWGRTMRSYLAGLGLLVGGAPPAVR